MDIQLAGDANLSGGYQSCCLGTHHWEYRSEKFSEMFAKFEVVWAQALYKNMATMISH